MVHMKRVPLAVAAIFLLASGQLLGAAATKPWYAGPLDSLGFHVFDPPYVPKEFKVKNMSGAETSNASVKGKIVLLNFWATWCPPCKAEIPGIETLSKTMKGKAFEVFAVNLGDDAATVAAFAAERKLSFPIYLDTKKSLASLYASQGIPTTYILDKDGRFIAGVVGGYNYTNPDLVKILNELASR